MKHTELPWEQIETRIFVRGNTFRIAVCDSNIADRSEEIANAAFIVRACNSHYELLEACEAALIEVEYLMDNWDIKEQLKAAIQKAKGI